jgi:two-component system sensor histidine kinase/response regulator
MSDKLILAPEELNIKKDSEPWIVLIADDDGAIHLVTEMVLSDFEFEDRPLKLLKAYSAEQTINVLKQEPKVAVLLLDVVMESLNAGLDAVPIIRNELKNKTVRIIIRTGHAGKATVSEIIRQYDINDFKNKTYLDHEKLKDTVILALRGYRDIIKNGCIDKDS